MGLELHKEMVGKSVLNFCHLNPLNYKVSMLIFWVPPVRDSKNEGEREGTRNTEGITKLTEPCAFGLIASAFSEQRKQSKQTHREGVCGTHRCNRRHF